VADMRIGLVVASVSRGAEIGQLLRLIGRQTVQPTRIVLSVERAADLPEVFDRERVEVIMGPKGLTGQRNRGLERVLGDTDVVVFYDDDFLPARDALAGIQALFRDNPGIVGATGLVIRDGVTQGGLSYEDSWAAVEQYERQREPLPIRNVETDSTYGCNMAFRCSAVADLRFDENLPLYAWQEDVDFAGQLLKKGSIVSSSAFAGVHRGVNKGRSPGLPLGFSQMINPVYLVRKGTMRRGKAIRLMVKNLIANHARAVRPEPHIDRVGRLRGNWLGLYHLATGRCDPRDILRLVPRPKTVQPECVPTHS